MGSRRKESRQSRKAGKAGSKVTKGKRAAGDRDTRGGSIRWQGPGEYEAREQGIAGLKGRRLRQGRDGKQGRKESRGSRGDWEA